MSTWLVTGGAGFIGSELVRQLVLESDARVVNYDKLTYAANLDALSSLAGSSRYQLERGDVCDGPALARVFEHYQPDGVLHLAAESHVDHSIDQPADFMQTNILGTFTLLERASAYFRSLEAARRNSFRLVHVSTDEVFGSLGAAGAFSEASAYCPSSPYSASKAAADHLARAWHTTYDLPVIVTNSSNNYGPWQFPEKLIPLMIEKGLSGEPLPVYGNGRNVRDWLYVADHASALRLVLERGRVGETYLLGGGTELTNLEVVEQVCSLLDELAPDSRHRPHRQLIEFVTDRPGHDFRYATDTSKVRRELGWEPSQTFASGLRKTVLWYVANRGFWSAARGKRGSSERVGLGNAGRT